MPLSKDQILSANDLPTRTVPVPQWGGDVILKTLNGSEREELERLINEFKSKGKIPGGKAVRAVAAAMSCVDENTGVRLFTNAEIPSLAKKSGAALDLLLDEILDLNGMTPEAAKELEGNSESDQSDDSGSS